MKRKTLIYLLGTLLCSCSLTSCGGGGGGGGGGGTAGGSGSSQNGNSNSNSNSNSNNNSSSREYAPYNMLGTLKSTSTGEFYNIYLNSASYGSSGAAWSYSGRLTYTRTGPNSGTLKGTMRMEVSAGFYTDRTINATLDFVSADECLMSGTYSTKMSTGRTSSGSLGGRWTMSLR